jgi:hypothetical protein
LDCKPNVVVLILLLEKSVIMFLLDRPKEMSRKHMPSFVENGFIVGSLFLVLKGVMNSIPDFVQLLKNQSSFVPNLFYLFGAIKVVFNGFFMFSIHIAYGRALKSYDYELVPAEGFLCSKEPKKG